MSFQRKCGAAKPGTQRRPGTTQGGKWSSIVGEQIAAAAATRKSRRLAMVRAAMERRRRKEGA